MQRAVGLVLSVMLVAACTAAPSPPREPILERRSIANGASGREDASHMLLMAVEPHGITCSSIEGSIWGDGKDRRWSWRTSCEGTERAWTRAEPELARLAADGIIRDLSKPDD
jgi:hypothetical protein